MADRSTTQQNLAVPTRDGQPTAAAPSTELEQETVQLIVTQTGTSPKTTTTISLTPSQFKEKVTWTCHMCRTSQNRIPPIPSSAPTPTTEKDQYKWQKFERICSWRIPDKTKRLLCSGGPLGHKGPCEKCRLDIPRGLFPDEWLSFEGNIAWSEGGKSGGRASMRVVVKILGEKQDEETGLKEGMELIRSECAAV